MLRQKISLIKESFLKEHKKEAIYSIVASVVNIALIALFTAYAIVSSPALLAAALVLFVATAPLQYITVAQKLHNYFLHASQSGCCKVLA
jgi:hypothetical protein